MPFSCVKPEEGEKTEGLCQADFIWGQSYADIEFQFSEPL